MCSLPLIAAACQQGPSGILGSPSATDVSQPAKPVQQNSSLPTLSAKFDGQKVGDGPIRVALLVPTGAQGGAGKIGVEMANAAKIAVRDFGAGRIQVIIKDTKGKAAQSSLLATQAKNEGASLVLGPLFSASVSGASSITQPAQLPMVAFSSDVSRAGNGTYLISFAPDNDMRRTLNHGISIGTNRVIALLPEGAYGTIAERELRRVMDANGGNVVAIARYGRDNNSKIAAARSIALQLENANAVYIPEGGETPLLMLRSLKQAGASVKGKQVLGSGGWEGVDRNAPELQGAIYAGANKKNYEPFAIRYAQTYGNRPNTNSAMAYDAVSLAAELVRRNQANPFSQQAIQSPGGFNGATGVFRFRSDGRIERGLVVNRIDGDGITIVSPAPAGFSRSG